MDPLDAARQELQDAIRILRDDGVHIHKTFARFQAAQNQETEEPSAPQVKEEPKEGDPPPVKEKEEKPPPKDWWFAERANRG